MFKQPLLFWTFLFVAIGVGLFLKMNQVSEKEGEKFRKLVESSPKEVRKNRVRQKQELTKQTRIGVTKRIYVSENPLRREMLLQAKRSELLVISDRPHIHVSETFYDVKGIVQQELFYCQDNGREALYSDAGVLTLRDGKVAPDTYGLQPMQRFRYFEADLAVYDFHSHQLVADGVTFWTYTTTGHDVVEWPLMLAHDAKGKASRMILNLNTNDQKQSFSAENLNVQFTPGRGL